jgi:putative MATE family efflux protein
MDGRDSAMEKDGPEAAVEAQAPSAPPVPHTGRDLTTGSIPRHLVAFALPMLAGNALQVAYSFVNAIWVGRYLGTDAMAALAVSFPVVFVLVALGAGMTLATSIQVAQHYGARDFRALRKVADNSVLLIAVLSVILTAVGEALAPAILRAMDTPPVVLPLAVHYLRVFLLTLPLMFGLFLTRSMLQGAGDSTTPLYFQSGALILNAGLDPVLMLGLAGMPRMGLAGAAWATVIAQALALVALVVWLERRQHLVAPAIRPREFDWPTTLTTLRIGLPSAVQQGLVSLGMVFVIRIVNGFGEVAAATFGVASRVDQLAFMPAMTFSMAVSTLTGQNIGAGKLHRIREIVVWGCTLSGGITLLASALAVGAPGLLLSIFTRDAALIAGGVTYLRIVGACYIFFAIMFVTNGVINGSGHTLMTTIISLVSLWAIRVPVGWWLSQHLGDVKGVWYAMALSFGVAMLVSGGYYATGRWRRPTVRRRPVVSAVPAAMVGEEAGEA